MRESFVLRKIKGQQTWDLEACEVVFVDCVCSLYVNGEVITVRKVNLKLLRLKIVCSSPTCELSWPFPQDAPFPEVLEAVSASQFA